MHTHLTTSMSALGVLTDLLGAKGAYYASFVIVLFAIGGLIYGVWRWIWPLLVGLPLSRWILKSRQKTGAEEARQLSDARNILATLAHDVLKHRLLGLVSLARSMDERLEADPDSWDKMRQELLRLCGARAAPHDRLWARWSEAFAQIRAIAGGRVVPPWADNVLCATDRKLARLKRHVRAFVAGEQEEALSPQVVRRLELGSISNIHSDVLSLTEGCRPSLVPRRVVEEALSALGALVDRKGGPERFEVRLQEEDNFLVDAPPRLVSTSLERLMDNALRLSPESAPLAIVVQLDGDELLGDEVLVFRVLDTLETIPEVEQFGDGLTEMRKGLAEYDCGFSFVRLTDDPVFAKEARITIPVTRGVSLLKGRRVFTRMRWAAPVMVVLLLLAMLSTGRILGGAPVQFSGGGQPVVEFRTRVGEELRFGLCEGGSNPSAILELETTSCRQEACSLADVVEALAPCRDGLSSPGCSREFVWTPEFDDGKREGMSYELTLACRAPGPPASEDIRRLRIVVSRQNSPPSWAGDVDVRVVGEGGRSSFELGDAPLEVPAGAVLELTLGGWDEDNDPLRYELVSQDETGGETVLASAERRPGQPVQLMLGQEQGIPWRRDSTFSAVLRISDGLAAPVERSLELEASELRPLTLERFAMWNEVTGEEVACAGPDAARLCRLVENEGYLAELDVRFDELLTEVNERIFLSPEKSKVQIEPVRDEDEDVQRKGRQGSVEVGQRWEVLSSIKGRRIATITLVDRPQHKRPGVRTYRFRIEMRRVEQGEPKSWTLRLSFDEASHRAAGLDQDLLLSIFDQSPSLLAERDFVKLREYPEGGSPEKGFKELKLFLAADSPQNAQLADPILRCERPELVDAFQQLELKRIAPNSWGLEVGLKPGCIEGLGGSASPLGSPSERTCRVELTTVDRSARSSVTIRVENAACAPRLVRVEPRFEEPVEEGAQITWQVEIHDPDGDLRTDGIMLKGPGSQNFKLSLTEDPDVLGTRLMGELTGKAFCGLGLGELRLEARDWTGASSSTPITARMQCNPVIRTASGEVRFEVDDGELLEIALLGMDQARVELDTPQGELGDGGFRWEADCENGRGPHVVRLLAERDGAQGTPLELEVTVRRCRVEMGLAELRTGTSVGGGGMLLMERARSKRLRVDPGVARLQDLELNITLEPKSKELSVRTLSGRGDIFDLFCTTANRTGTIVVEAKPLPDAAQSYLEIEPLRVRVRCVEQGSSLIKRGTP